MTSRTADGLGVRPMATEVISPQFEANRHVLIVTPETNGQAVQVREGSGEGGAAEASAPVTMLYDWLAANHVCPCPERRSADEELEKKMEELARSNEALEQYASVAAHDLQEPLRMVAAYTQLLAEKYRGRLDEDADRYIAYASDGARRMQTLVRDLLSYSRLGACDSLPKVAGSGLALDEALRNLQQAIEESGATIRSGELPDVAACRTQLSQVFQNLIGNAIKFRSASQTLVIEVEAKQMGERWQFSVRDNGIGIPPEKAEEVFAIFHRLHTRAEYPGNGIGLAICKRIVESFGGRIWLEPAPRGGTEFKFTLPAVESNEKGGAR